MTIPILYSFRRCPYAMRARMAIACAEIKTEQRDILLKDKPQEMLDASPKGTVPVLVLPDGKIIDESLDIMHWALENNDPDNWLSEYDSILIEENDNEFKSNLDRYKYSNRYPDENCSNALDNCLTFIKELDTRLDKNKYLSANHITLTDIAIFPFIRQFSKVDPAMWKSPPYPKVKAWLDAHLNSDLFINIMEKHPIWKNEEKCSLST